MDTDQIKASNTSLVDRRSLTSPDQPWFVRMFTGIKIDPALVRAARGLIYLAVIAGFNLAILHFREVPAWGLAEDNGIILTFLIAAEAIFDQYLKGSNS